MYWFLAFSALEVIACALLLSLTKADHYAHSRLCKRGEETDNSQAQTAAPSKVLFDLNSSPPISPVENIAEPTMNLNEAAAVTSPAKKGRNGRKRFLSGEERRKYDSDYYRNRAKSFTKEGIEKAKATLKGSELNIFLARAKRYRSTKNRIESKYRKERSNRFKAGTQTLNDEHKRHMARQRTQEARKNRARMASDQ
ncbi:uncharacterized protein FA14DRAFT_185130 [Meira miltonrushii]|uniref:BZIP domain-containing protein n=1 Tax=Meira miltonrushii TaxID=1280837 RepID=A0A316V7B2_9BASI|nr:uncharacterized protein FA14DRAFT_185130 [Meira miltonrushii]PWN33332.1 hypothetical protein FA14DRAFT_185130 [Meira miltonrushii]